MPSVNTHMFDSYFLHKVTALQSKIISEEQFYSSLLVLFGFFFFVSSLFFFLQKKMAMLSGFAFVLLVQTVNLQLTPRGPRPIPGRGDSPEPTVPPLLPEPTPRPEGCEGEGSLNFFLA